jgi:Holliday junction resolvase-like predicted endonuclease
MLTEDEVVAAVCSYLQAHDYEIVTRALATEHGHDVVAEKNGTQLFVEAKGAGSSKEGTARYGKAFTRNQVFDHVAKAVLKAMRIISAGSGRAAVALPDNEDHRREIDQIREALHGAGIAAFLVSDSAEVRLDSPWPL